MSNVASDDLSVCHAYAVNLMANVGSLRTHLLALRQRPSDDAATRVCREAVRGAMSRRPPSWGNVAPLWTGDGFRHRGLTAASAHRLAADYAIFVREWCRGLYRLVKSNKRSGRHHLLALAIERADELPVVDASDFQAALLVERDRAIRRRGAIHADGLPAQDATSEQMSAAARACAFLAQASRDGRKVTFTELAKIFGKNRTAFLRDTQVKAAWRAYQSGFAMKIPKGHRHAESGIVDAYDDD